MKLRIQAGSLRLRLAQSEVNQFAQTGRVEESVALGPGQEWVYALAQKAGIDQVGVSFADNRLTVWAPRTLAQEWAGTDRVGFEGELVHEDGRRLFVLVEKDFASLHR